MEFGSIGGVAGKSCIAKYGTSSTAEAVPSGEAIGVCCALVVEETFEVVSFILICCANLNLIYLVTLTCKIFMCECYC